MFLFSHLPIQLLRSEYTIRSFALIIVVRIWQGKIPNPEIQKNLKLCEYVEYFLLIKTQFLFPAQIHSKGVKLTPENSAIFRFYFATRNP